MQVLLQTKASGCFFLVMLTSRFLPSPSFQAVLPSEPSEPKIFTEPDRAGDPRARAEPEPKSQTHKVFFPQKKQLILHQYFPQPL